MPKSAGGKLETHLRLDLQAIPVYHVSMRLIRYLVIIVAVVVSGLFATVTLVKAQSNTGRIPQLLANWLQTLASLDFYPDQLVNSLDFVAGLHSPSLTGTPTPSPNWPALQLQPYISGLNNPVHFTHAADNSGRVFVLEQAGKIRIIKNNQLLSTPFLDLTSKVSSTGERGLLGLAFPPNYATLGYFFVNYTNSAGHTVVARYHTSQNPDQALSDEFVILTVNQPFANHNGGTLQFGPDGYLYIGMGDGGSSGDPNNRAQNLNDLLGKLLRINVVSTQTYTIPSTNPFANGGGRPEIWALGLRNPWKFSFDSATGDLFIADVGQGNWEELNFQPANTSRLNYGWRCKEGDHNYNFVGGCSSLNLINPVAEYNHSGGNCSVTGGHIYRGSEYPDLQNIYLYGDYCSGRVWGLRRVGSAWQSQQLLDTTHQISSFGEDQDGQLYLLDHGGTIYRIVTSN